MAVEGKMQYLFDESGRRYLDVSLLCCTNAAPSSCMNALPVSRLAQNVLDASLRCSTVGPHANEQHLMSRASSAGSELCSTCML